MYLYFKIFLIPNRLIGFNLEQHFNNIWKVINGKEAIEIETKASKISPREVEATGEVKRRDDGNGPGTVGTYLFKADL